MTGLLCAPCTPFKDNGDVDLDKIPSYVQHILDFGIPNLFVTGTMGEGMQLTVEERKQVIEAFVKASKGKMSTVIAHIGSNNLRDTQALAAHAQKVGADAIACIGTSFYKPSSLDAYIDYMKQVAASAPNLPFYLYDFDIMTGISYDVSSFFKAAERVIPTLRGVKHTSANFVSMQRSVDEHQGKFDIIAGTEDGYIEALAAGVNWTTVTHFLGHPLTRLQEAFHRGDFAAARLEQRRIIQITRIRLKYASSYPESAKAVSRAIGFDLGDPRSPLNKVSSSAVDNIKKELTEIGFFEWGLKK